MSDLDLTSLEQDVLAVLAESRITSSAVVVAIDLADRRPGFEQGGDPIGLTTFVLGGLNEKGLITFRLREPLINTAWPADLPLDIRLTPEGWAAAGYPGRVGVVGTESRHAIPPRHPGDRTDYRTHGYHSQPYFPTERLPLTEHLDRYPGHLFHLYGGPFVSDHAPDPVITRAYTKVTADIEASVIIYRSEHPHASYGEIADEVGVPERTVKYILTDRARLRGLAMKTGDEATDEESLKARMLRVITDFGPFRDVFDLRTVLATGEDIHNITHLLTVLKRQGLVTYKTRNKGTVTTYSGIRARTRRERTAVPVEPDEIETADGATQDILPTTQEDGSPASPSAEVAEIIEPQSVEAEAPSDEAAPEEPAPVHVPITIGEINGHWPELALIIEAERERMAAEEKVAVFVRAAESLVEIDPATAESLMVRATEIAKPAPTRIEAEYLAFARQVLDAQQDR